MIDLLYQVTQMHSIYRNLMHSTYRNLMYLKEQGHPACQNLPTALQSHCLSAADRALCAVRALRSELQGDRVCPQGQVNHRVRGTVPFSMSISFNWTPRTLTCCNKQTALEDVKCLRFTNRFYSAGCDWAQSADLVLAASGLERQEMGTGPPLLSQL